MTFNSGTMLSMQFSIIAGLILTLGAARSYLFAQINTASAAHPRIVLTLPDNLASDSVTVWYDLIMAKQSKTGPLKRQSNVRQYVVDAVIDGQPARSATIYIYAPGCQFKTYDFELNKTFDLAQRFECAPLATKTIHGFILPAEIPLSFLSKRTELDILGELEANWICNNAFLRAAERSGGQGVAGSCLVPSIPLGKVGQLHPADDGNFELKIPDFTQDPVFKSKADEPTNIDFGYIELSLKDEQVGRPVGTISASDFNSPEHGLEILTGYPDPVIFTRVH
jgi:hypothetical protein